MKFHTETHIVIDARKLEMLLRLGCEKDVIFNVICGKKHKSSGDKLIDDLLECLATKKTYNNWGGNRRNAGRKHFQVENQDENQVENQDESKLGTITLTSTTGVYSRNNTSNLSTTRVNPTLDEILDYARQQNDLAGMGGFKCSPDTAHDFYDYYSGIGWCLPNDAKTPILDWKPFLRKWARKPQFKTHEPETVNIDDPDHFVI